MKHCSRNKLSSLGILTVLPNRIQAPRLIKRSVRIAD